MTFICCVCELCVLVSGGQRISLDSPLRHHAWVCPIRSLYPGHNLKDHKHLPSQNTQKKHDHHHLVASDYRRGWKGHRELKKRI